MKFIWSFLSVMICALAQGQISYVFEDNKTFTYEECIDAYKHLEEKYLTVELKEYGPSDSGRPIHLFVMGDVDKENKPTILINNGIHPGESCGIDASIKFAEDLLSSDNTILNRVNICIIPVYNIGGCLNRNTHSRANQNGPDEHGFRGNARNLDLNRDFIKCDSRNTEAFYRIFQDWEPEIFVDTHTSNGADYQYVMTLIASQVDKLNPELRNFVRGSMLPHMFKSMEDVYPMTPYVNTMGRTPEEGIADFIDSPRFASGYAALFNSIGFITETHMLKPYRDRVLSTYYFLNELTKFTADNGENLVQLKRKADRHTRKSKEIQFNYQLDSTLYQMIEFKGFEHYYEKSSVTLQDQLYYSKNPKTFQVKQFSNYIPRDTVQVPTYYIIPQAWREVVDHLKMHKVKMKRLKEDAEIEANFYYIEDHETNRSPYEGHFLHKDVVTRDETQKVLFLKGDYIVKMDQVKNRYIAESLEPRTVDSFFVWNYFDGILQQKEWFSDYVFDKEAQEILANDPELEREFRKMQKEDADFAKNHWAQLYYIYKASEYFEKSVFRYPVARVFRELEVGME
ncbi:MAG: hypothetical protein HKN39_03435 [Flavobacteriales bacterium]|nr:hypothetical protein [Flavobacteriales bacterium]